MDREILQEIFDRLSEIAHEYGDEYDFGKWYYKRKIEGIDVTFEVCNGSKCGRISKRFGFAYMVDNLILIEEFLDWIELQ